MIPTSNDEKKYNKNQIPAKSQFSNGKTDLFYLKPKFLPQSYLYKSSQNKTIPNIVLNSMPSSSSYQETDDQNLETSGQHNKKLSYEKKKLKIESKPNYLSQSMQNFKLMKKNNTSQITEHSKINEFLGNKSMSKGAENSMYLLLNISKYFCKK